MAKVVRFISVLSNIDVVALRISQGVNRSGEKKVVKFVGKRHSLTIFEVSRRCRWKHPCRKKSFSLANPA